MLNSKSNYNAATPPRDYDPDSEWVCMRVWDREKTYQHSVNVQTPVDWWEVHQVLSCKNLSGTDQETRPMSNICWIISPLMYATLQSHFSKTLIGLTTDKNPV